MINNCPKQTKDKPDCLFLCAWCKMAYREQILKIENKAYSKTRNKIIEL